MPTLALPRWIPRRPQSWGLILAAVALGAFLWTQFLHSQSQARHRAVVETASRASQIADAVALHADTLVSGIDVAMQYLAGEYPDARPETFENSVRTSIAAFPQGAIAQISVADAQGIVAYSSLGVNGRVDVSDREHIRVHMAPGPPRMYIGAPVLGRVSQQWTVQFTRPVLAGGRFAGVVVISVPTRYFADALARVSIGGGDTINLVRTDGRWIARTGELERAMTQRMPPDRPYFARAQGRGEVFRGVSQVDGALRITGWRRLQSADIVAIVGIDERESLADLLASQRAALATNAAASVVCAVLVFVVASLLDSLYRARAHLEQRVARRTAELSAEVAERTKAQAALRLQGEQLESTVEARTAQLRVASEAAEAASRAKSAFLANMSHEIRTPLNAITGMAYLLKRSSPTPQQSERIDKIVGASHHLLEIISAVLELSKIEAGKVELQDAIVSLEAVAADVVAMVAEQARARGATIVVEPMPALPEGLRGDPTRLQQALLNYLSNAIKFAPGGTVTLRARFDEVTDDVVLVRFEVRDDGIGIAPDVLPRLFAAFEQGDPSLTRQYGGIGLGLALTRNLARLMGGDAGASSTPGAGSTFWFSARLARSRSTAGSREGGGEAPDAILRAEFGGRRVLVAEDDPVNRELVEALLTIAGLVPEAASNGVEALELARRARYDLVLMDVQMPSMNGLDATRVLRGLPGYDAVPVIALTANAFAQDRDRCLEAGMDDFVPKPIEPGLLFETLLRWLRSPATA